MTDEIPTAGDVTTASHSRLYVLSRGLGIFLLGFAILGVASVIAMTITQVAYGGMQGSPAWFLPMLTHICMLVLTMPTIRLISRGQCSSFGMRKIVRCAGPAIPLLSLGVGLLANVLLVMLDLDFNPIGQFSIWQSILFIWILASVAEEILCRGLLQTLWGKVIPNSPWWPIVLSAIFFMMIHLPLITLGAPPAAVGILLVAAFLLGGIAGYARAYTGSIIPAIAAHAFFNITGSLTMWITL